MIRVFDIGFSLLAIIILFPFMVPIMIGLKCTGEHDIFYKQERIGKGGKPFHLLKFATMVRNSPNLPGGLFTAENDPRILPMGKFLRKTKINELPQLFNILIGQMSIIGYRPTVRSEYETYPEDAKDKLNLIRPGLSGVGSVIFRNEEQILQKVGDKKEAFYQKVISPYKQELEVWYVDHRKLTLYFKLILLTVDAVIRPDSNMWEKSLQGLPPLPEELKQYMSTKE